MKYNRAARAARILETSFDATVFGKIFKLGLSTDNWFPFASTKGQRSKRQLV